MKKLVILLISLLSICSCIMKQDFDNSGLIYNNFHDECSFGDSVFFYMNCNVSPKEAEFYFVKRELINIQRDTISVWENLYIIKNSDTYITNEVYKYNSTDFKKVLIEKSFTPRDTTVFKFSKNMYMTWSCFDEIYKTYIE